MFLFVSDEVGVLGSKYTLPMSHTPGDNAFVICYVYDPEGVLIFIELILPGL